MCLRILDYLRASLRRLLYLRNEEEVKYEELLAYINKEIDEAAWTKEYYPLKSLQALRSVMELHKPQEITLPNGDWGLNCVLCDGFAYPCDTIETVERELSE